MPRKSAGLMFAAAAAIGLTTAFALPASASATNYFEIAVQVGTFAPVMCLQPADPAGGAGTAIVQQPCTAGNQAQNWAPVGVAAGRARHAALHLQRHRRPGLGHRRPRRLIRLPQAPRAPRPEPGVHPGCYPALRVARLSPTDALRGT